MSLACPKKKNISGYSLFLIPVQETGPYCHKCSLNFLLCEHIICCGSSGFWENAGKVHYLKNTHKKMNSIMMLLSFCMLKYFFKSLNKSGLMFEFGTFIVEGELSEKSTGTQSNRCAETLKNHCSTNRELGTKMFTPTAF